jgi:hypothetical protein
VRQYAAARSNIAPCGGEGHATRMAFEHHGAQRRL